LLLESALALIVVCLGVAIARATPEAAMWRRQTLAGENAKCFFRYRATSLQSGTHYAYSRTLHLQKVQKSDFRVLEDIPLLDVSYEQDLETMKWTERPVSLPPFDLAGYLRVNGVHIPFSEDLARTFAIDSGGVWEVFEDGRVQLATLKELHRQIPELGDDPRVVGIEHTGFSPPDGAGGYYYLRVWSSTAAIDVDWSEDLLLVPRAIFR
jgi:hypothetical protein